MNKLDELADLRIRVEGHKLIANDWGTTNLTLLIINIVLSALAASALFETLQLPAFVGETAALLVTINSGLIAGLNPADRVTKHREAIAEYSEAKRLPSDQIGIRMDAIQTKAPNLRFKTRLRARKRLEDLHGKG